MRQPFRVPVTGSRTWNDSAIIEHAPAAILARHPRQRSRYTGPARMEPTPSLPPTPPRHRATASRRTQQTAPPRPGRRTAPDRRDDRTGR